MTYEFHHKKFATEFLEEAGETNDYHLSIAPGASGIATCRRQQGYRLEGAEIAPSRSVTDIGEDYFARIAGNLLEPAVNDVLRRLGIVSKGVQASWAAMECRKVLVASDQGSELLNDQRLQEAVLTHNQQGRRKKPHSCTVILTGHPDGVLDGASLKRFFRGGEHPHKVLFELKFLGTKRYVDLVKAGGVEYNDDDGQYFYQAQANMHAMGCEVALLVGVAKDKSAVKWNGRQWKYEGPPFLHTELVPFNKKAAKWAVDRGEELVMARDRTRDYEPTGSKAHWRCRWCDWHERCVKDLVKENPTMEESNA